jgi:hypothetical protein
MLKLPQLISSSLVWQFWFTKLGHDTDGLSSVKEFLEVVSAESCFEILCIVSALDAPFAYGFV